MSHWIEVRPRGYLKKFGDHKFYVDSPAQAIRAMMVLVPGFEEAFIASEKKGLRFQVLTDKRQVSDADHLRMGTPKTVTLVPKQAGSKNSGVAFLAVAAIIAATIVTGGAAAGFAAAGLSSTAAATGVTILTSVAVSLALGGITQLLTPQPEGLKSRTDPENEASYAFGGPVNTTAQGNPVPLFYGYREVGGAVISASLVSEDKK